MTTDIILAARANGLPRLRELLSDPAAQVNALGLFRFTELSWAAKSGRYEAAALLVDAGAELEVPG